MQKCEFQAKKDICLAECKQKSSEQFYVEDNNLHQFKDGERIIGTLLKSHNYDSLGIKQYYIKLRNGIIIFATSNQISEVPVKARSRKFINFLNEKDNTDI